MRKITLTLLSTAALLLSGNFYQIQAGTQIAKPDPDKPKTQNFKEPLVGTFYYPWWEGEEKNYAGWDIDNHQPPDTWRSMYLPDMIPGKFDPKHELYSVTDPITIRKQLGWMKQAGIQFSIASWFGPGSSSDEALQKMIQDIMPDPHNPYPGIKWTILYEDEGDGDPSVDEIIQDLVYIKKYFASSSYYLRIDGKPVVFVYNTESSMKGSLDELERWSQVREQTGFYIVMRDDPLNIGGGVQADLMDGWYRYKPGLRFDQLGNYSASVSPGYWIYHDENATLARDPVNFEKAVAKLSDAKVMFKLILTWNEWKEGTGIEPAQQIVHDDRYSFLPAKESYGESYLNILAAYFRMDVKTSMPTLK